MLETSFENNERNVSKNIVKLNLKQNTNLLYNHLVYICVREACLKVARYD